MTTQLQTLSSITPSRWPVSTIALIIGQEGPKPIRRRDGSETHLTILQLSDSTLPIGLELRIWGSAALSTTSHRIMDIVRVEKVVCNSDPRFPHINFLTYRSNSSIVRDSSPAASDLTIWRHETFPELESLARAGSVRTRAWSTRPKRGRIGPKARRAGGRCVRDAAEMTEEGILELCVEICGVRISGGDGDLKNALKELVRSVCVLCGAGGVPGERSVCECVEGVGWRFGELYVVVADASGRAEVKVCGEQVERLLLGISAERVWKCEGDRKVAADVLVALSIDGGQFRVLLKMDAGLSLVGLFV